MPSLKVNVYPKSLEIGSDNSINVRVSSKPDNGLSIDPSTGQLIATRGKDGVVIASGNANTPSNGVAGTVGQHVAILRFNSTVSRKRRSTGIAEGVVIDDTFIDHILGR